MNERESYWARRLETRLGQTVEIQAAFNGLPVSFQGVVAKDGDCFMLRGERGVYPVMIGQNASGQPVVRPEVVPESEHDVFLGDIVSITRRLETRDQAAEELKRAGLYPEPGGRVVAPQQGLFVPRG